jgi:hypothetical protein
MRQDLDIGRTWLRHCHAPAVVALLRLAWMLARRSSILLLSSVLLARMPALGEQLRIVVAQPEFSVGSEASGKQFTNSAALWCSLVGTELSRQNCFALLEREELPSLAGELALAAANGATNRTTLRPDWLGADCLVLTKWQAAGGTNKLVIKILDVEKGGIETELAQSFTDDGLEKAALDLAKELRPLSLRLLSRRQIHTAVSVLDYDSDSRFERGRWQERALARRLRAFLQRQPGVLVLEREDVEELLRETRLRRGGLAGANSALTNAWLALRHYPLV